MNSSAKRSDTVQQAQIDSYTFDLDGLTTAPDVAEVEEALEQLEGVRARIVFPRKRAWVSAPDDVGVDKIQAVFAQHGVSATLRESASYRRRTRHRSRPKNLSWQQRRQVDDERRAFRSARAAGYFEQDPHATAGDVLVAARDVITWPRFLVALILSIPVVVLSYTQSLQFNGWQWVALGLALPVVTWGAWPFHRALFRGTRRGLTALDGASSIAIIAATLWSIAMLVFTSAGESGWRSVPTWFAINRGQLEGGELFLDVATGMTCLLLFGRLLMLRTRVSLLDEIDAELPDPHAIVTVVERGRSKEPVELPLQEVNVGDDVFVDAGQTIPVDGTIIGGSGRLDQGVIHTGLPGEVQVGSAVFAGATLIDGHIKVRAVHTGHATRLSAIRDWVSLANQQINHATMVSIRSAAALIPVAITLAAVGLVGWWLLTSNWNAAFAVALSVLASVSPVAVTLVVASSAAVRHGIEAAARHGVLLRDSRTLRALDTIDTVIFNRLGTLAQPNMDVQSVTALEGENEELLIRVAGALAVESDHPSSQALVRAARESRDRYHSPDIPGLVEVTGVTADEDGTFRGSVRLPGDDGEMRAVEAVLWRPRTMSQLPRGPLARAVEKGGTPLVVRWKGIDRGVVTLTDPMCPDAPQAITDLDEMGVETVMVSRDVYPVARTFADRVGIDFVMAGITADRKPHAVRSVRAHNGAVAMVADQSALTGIAAAEVGVLMDPRGADRVDNQLIDAVLLRSDVTAVSRMIRHARRICRIMDRNLLLAWGYHSVMVVLSLLGLVHPMAATVLTVGISLVIELLSNQARRF